MRLARCLSVLALFAAVSCASGYPSQPENMIEPPEPPPPPVFTGEACEVGDRVACECDGGKGMGVRACVPSDASPTKGMLSDCVSCIEMPSAGSAARTGAMSSAQTASSAQAGRKADAGGSTAVSGGQGGAAVKASGGAGASAGGKGGSSSSSTSSAAVGGSGGSKSNAGGAGGSGGGSGGRGGMSGGSAAGSGGRNSGRCECNTGCLLTGVFPCCHSDGSCGCTWAPGAYCM